MPARPSIRRRLTIHFLVVIAALTLLANLILYYRVRMALKHQYDDGLLSRAGALSHLVAWDENGKMILEIPEKALDEFNRAAAPDYLQVWRPDGTTFLRSAGLHGHDLYALADDSPQFWYLTLPDGRPGRATAFHFYPHLEADESSPPAEFTATHPVSPPQGQATLILASDMDRVQAFLHELLAAQIIGSILLAAICAGIVILAIRRGLVPLKRLGEEAAHFPVASLDRRFSESDLPAELQPIVGRLNDLLSRIEEAFRRERRFTSNVAHELRTPIAELRSLAEVALACRPASTDNREYEEALAIARQMQSLVESLLALARAESSPAAPQLCAEPLESLIKSSMKPFLPAAASRHLDIQLDISRGEIATDRSLLEPLLRNILSNAIAYAPPHSSVAITAKILERHPHISITNAAPNLTESDVSHFAEPFWRKDAARSDGQHAGLGFPLALAYARMLGLAVTPRLSAGNLTLHIAPAAATVATEMPAAAPAFTGAA